MRKNGHLRHPEEDEDAHEATRLCAIIVMDCTNEMCVFPSLSGVFYNQSPRFLRKCELTTCKDRSGVISLSRSSEGVTRVTTVVVFAITEGSCYVA